MNEALIEAKKAFDLGEIPVGAVIVYNDKIIARAHNKKEINNDFLGHAEIEVMKIANKVLNTWRLENCSLYVTLEPCSMCAGAMIQSRIKNLYYGAFDNKTGAVSSVLNLLDYSFNHKIEYVGGILENESSRLLKDFFKKIRENK